MRAVRRVSCLSPRGPALVIATVLAAAPVGAQQAPDRVDRLGWLAGCWQNVRGDYVTEEQWMVPRGGTLFGMSRTVTRGRTVEYEFLRVTERQGRLVFISRPSGQREAEFVEAELSDSIVAYENPSHDFPQRIVYRLQPDGSLAARIEGSESGTRRSVDFPLRRAPCR
ncbi:MAG: DUF6265 family protein [Gemmatimonadales bacterium]